MPIILNGSSGITYPDNTTQTTTAQVVKAWVNFNGQGTVAIRASFNVSSITDNNTGDYSVNFTTAFSDANYTVVGSVAGVPGSADIFLEIHTQTGAIADPTTTVARVISVSYAGVLYDSKYVSVAVFR